MVLIILKNRKWILTGDASEFVERIGLDGDSEEEIDSFEALWGVKVIKEEE